MLTCLRSIVLKQYHALYHAMIICSWILKPVSYEMHDPQVHQHNKIKSTQQHKTRCSVIDDYRCLIIINNSVYTWSAHEEPQCDAKSVVEYLVSSFT